MVSNWRYALFIPFTILIDCWMAQEAAGPTHGYNPNPLGQSSRQIVHSGGPLSLEMLAQVPLILWSTDHWTRSNLTDLPIRFSTRSYHFSLTNRTLHGNPQKARDPFIYLAEADDGVTPFYQTLLNWADIFSTTSTKHITINQFHL